MTTAERVAQVHYRRNEWSGHTGSAWANLPEPVRDKLVREAQEWLNSIGVAGLIVSHPVGT